MTELLISTVVGLLNDHIEPVVTKGGGEGGFQVQSLKIKKMLNSKLNKILLTLLGLFVATQVILRLTYGAFTLYIQNQNIANNYSAEVFVDDSLVGEYRFDDKDIIPQKLSLQGKFGNRKLTVKRSDTSSQLEREFSNYLVKWIVVTLNENGEIIIQEYYIPPLLQ